jgi:hypothetical protein
MNIIFAENIGTPKFKKPLRIWSNYPVEFSYVPAQDGATWPGANKPVILKTEPLDIFKLYAFSPEMSWGFVFIDELDRLADRQDWQNGGQKLLMQILVQIGKRHLSLGATIQTLAWVNPRYMFQVDMTTACRDAAKTSWGMRNGLDPGEMTFLYSQDKSGGTTGFTYEENGRIHEANAYLSEMFKFYNTDEEQDPFAKFDRVSVKKRHLVLDPHAKEENNSYNNDVKILEETIKSYINEGNLKPERAEYIKRAEKMGMVMNTTEAIEYIAEAHNVRKYASTGTIRLDLSKVKNIFGVTKPSKTIKPRVRQKPTKEEVQTT